MVEIAIFSISLMAYIPCTGNDTPETNTWLNLQKIRCTVIWKGAGCFSFQLIDFNKLVN
jgi:hypothetical protein